MRISFALFLLLAGVVAGLLSAIHDDWGVKAVMMLVGAMFGGAIGGVVAQSGRRNLRRRRWLTEEEISPIPGMGMSGRDMAANFWRDRGHPPFAKPPRAEHGNHMFDADKNL